MTDEADRGSASLRTPSRSIFESRWFTVRQDTIELPGGKETCYTWIDHPGYVVVVPVLADGQVVMERIYRHPLGRKLLECPSGGLDADSPAAAAKRELEEETGYCAGRVQELGRFAGSSGISNEFYHVVLATDLVRGAPIRRDPTELIEIELFAFHKLQEMVFAGEIEEGPSALAILLAGRLLQKIAF